MTAAARAALAALDDVGVGPVESAAGAHEPLFVLCDGDLGASAQALVALVEAVRAGPQDLAVAVFATRVGGGFGLTLAYARRVIERRCGLRMRAPLSGQRALRAEVLREALPFAGGYGMEVGMTIDAHRHGRRLVEVELELDHRPRGRTPRGFIHRAIQLRDVALAERARARPRTRTRNLGRAGR